MELYLMQHGQSVNEQEDPARPLSRDGVEQVQATARAIRRLGLSFDVIICSPKRRAHQTAALVAEAIRYPYSDILESESVVPQADPGKLMQKLAQMIGDKILVVGHLPNLSRIVGHLLGSDRDLVRFENGGLVGIVRSVDGSVLTTVLTAGQLRLLGKG